VQVIRLSDAVAPVIVSQTENMTVECGNEYSVAPAQFSDNCDQELDITSDFSSSNDGCTTIETYTWTATDHCNNSTTATTVVTIVDTTNPYFTSLPENATVNCDETIPGFGEYAAADNCDDQVEVMVEESMIPGNCPQSYTIERVYRAADNCGNQVVESRYVYVIDTQAPSFDEQGNTFTYECNEEIPVIEPSANDNCGMVTLNFIDGGNAPMSFDGFDLVGSYNGKTYLVTNGIMTWSQANLLAQSLPYSGATLAVFETLAENNAVDALTSEYNEYLWFGLYQDPSSPDYSEPAGGWKWVNNAPLTYTNWFAGEPNNGGGENFGHLKRYPNGLWNDWNSVGVSRAIIEIDGNQNPISNGCESTFTRTWTATDECGNSSTFDQYITIVDTQAPVVNPYTMAIDMPCDAVSNNIMISAEDCNEVVITYTDEYVSGGCAGKIMRTYAVSDVCGNQTSGLIQQIITLIDVTAPTVATAPADVEIECGEEAPAYSPIWNDNCDQELSLSDSSSITSDACTSVIYQSWTASDACGNSTTVSRTITIVDSTAPEFTSVPQNENRECTQEDVVAPAYAIDNCSDVTITHSDVIVGGQCAANYTIERTYRATDE
jgi:hypothetical protein